MSKPLRQHAGQIPTVDLENPKAWAALMAADEQILWQSRPEKYQLNTFDARLAQITSLALVGAAIAVSATFSHHIWVGGVSFGLSVAALALALGPLTYRALQHRNVIYTLTNKRALISRTMLGPTGWVDTDGWALEHDIRPRPDTGDIGNLWFAEEPHPDGRRTIRFGFRHIAQPQQVACLMQQAIKLRTEE